MSELYHYGVKGMKWGVRKEPEKGATKTMKKIAEKYNGKVQKQGSAEPSLQRQHRREISRVRDAGGLELRVFETKYNSKTGKYERTNNPPSVYRSHATPNSNTEAIWEEEMRDKLEDDYTKVHNGKKPKVYVDENGVIWQWSDARNDYIKVGGTKGKMKETFGYKVSQIGKKIGDGVNKAVETGKSFLSNLFKKK